MAGGQRNWTWNETLMAWALYMILPSKALVATDSHIQALARAIGRSDNAVKMKAWNIAAQDERRIRKGLKGLSQGSVLDRRVWEAFAQQGDALLLEAINLLDEALSQGVAFEGRAYGVVELPVELPAVELPVGATREATVAARVNQNYFRNRLMENYSGRCCLTGLSVDRLLVASHIKPWSVADPATERLAPDNGLLLNSLHDRAFDQGLITLDRDLRVVVSPVVPADDEAACALLWAYEGRRIALPEAFPPRKEFLEYHNDVVFRRSA